MIINRSFQTLIVREIWRFLSLYKQTIMPGAISSSLYIIIFGHALGAKIGDIGGVPYMHYIIPGLIMMSVVTHAYQNSSSSIMQAKYLKFIEDYLIAPMSPMEICFGFIIGATFRGLMNGIVVILISWVLTGFTVYSITTTLLYLIIVSWAFGAIGVIIGVCSKSWDHVGAFTNFVFMPLTMLGGVFWSIDMLPSGWQLVTKINPLYWMINGLRYSTLQITDVSIYASLFICLFFAILFSSISIYLVSIGYKIKS